jgi:large subunit ribosomal protein L24
LRLFLKGGSDVKLKKGDTVQVIAGDSIDKRGKIIEVLPKKNKIVVEDVNIKQKHVKPSQEMPQGGITDFPAPIDVSNVMLVCSKCNLPTRVKIERRNGEKIRICGKCGKEVS